MNKLTLKIVNFTESVRFYTIGVATQDYNCIFLRMSFVDNFLHLITAIINCRVISFTYNNLIIIFNVLYVLRNIRNSGFLL